MRRLVLFLLVIGLACEAPQEFGMSSVITPDPSNHPTDFTVPTAGDPVASGVVDAAYQALADMIVSVEVGSGSFAEMAAFNGGQVPFVPGYGGSSFRVANQGRYYWTTSGGLPAEDGFWIIDGVGGTWIHELKAFRNFKLAGIGPNADDTFTDVTAAGRLPRSIIQNGWFRNDADGGTPISASTTSTSIVTLGPSPLANLGSDIDGGCQVRLYANAMAVVTAGSPTSFNVSTEISLDNGGSWSTVANKNNLQYGSPTNNIMQSVMLSFSMLTSPAPTGNVLIRFRGFLATAGTLVLNVDTWEVWVTRG